MPKLIERETWYVLVQRDCSDFIGVYKTFEEAFDNLSNMVRQDLIDDTFESGKYRILKITEVI